MRGTELARLSKEQGRNVAQSFGTSLRIAPLQGYPRVRQQMKPLHSQCCSG